MLTQKSRVFIAKAIFKMFQFHKVKYSKVMAFASF